ncbi:phage holin family protein [Brucepastera parasyntrophica]|uniref:phage holin family protein n=1 Tax=Brucepastera parasyntrophica TaxID=2880008 RepID=UPI00210D5C1A|nr:phage holin family protein [Brucepastera parasyntrophica]ULQ59248.1 phage holin family protein [Brucepastera parasyntrophica]
MDLTESLEQSLAGKNTQGLLSLALSVWAYVSGGFTYLFPVLVILMLIDYVTGIIAAIINERPFSVDIAIKGLIRKVLYLFCVVFAQLMDAVVLALNHTGILNIDNFRYFGLLVSVYLIGTEGLSIMRNFADCEMPMPKPFLKFFKYISKTDKGEKAEDEKKGEGKEA